VWIAEGETHALEALPAGSRAYTTAVATFVPAACREFWKLGVAGDRAGMEAVLKKRIEPIVKVRGVKSGYGVSGIKVALEALGRSGGIVRPPGMQVQPEDRAVIAEIARNHSESAKTDKSATG
jgi:dihydrodipicolinate synthase/N-acetylneuraminate lyase